MNIISYKDILLRWKAYMQFGCSNNGIECCLQKILIDLGCDISDSMAWEEKEARNNLTLVQKILHYSKDEYLF